MGAVSLLLASSMFSWGQEPTPAVAKQDVQNAFKSTLVKIEVQPDKDIYPVEWVYTNPNELPLVVQELKSSCDCLAVHHVGPEQLAKGESAKITATFSPGYDRGLIRKSIHVLFVAYDKPVELVVEVKIPSPVKLSAQELTWTAESIDKAQSVDITTETGADFCIMELSGVPDSLFTITKETVTEKRHYRLHIKPADQAAPGIQTLRIRTDSLDPRDQFIEVYLRLPKS